jgi:phage shock protein PspC (stress-responsive transcriptional regulator)
VIAEMGPVQGDGDAAGGAGTASAASAPAPESGSAPRHPRRLFRIREGAKIGGVCNGVAAYFGIEVTIVRLLFVFVALTFGAGVLAYVIMMFVIPTAETPAEKAEACGSPATADDFIRRAREGYYEGIKTFGDKRAYREWRRRFKQDMRRHKYDFQQQMHRTKHDWHAFWEGRGDPHTGAHFASPILSLAIFVISVAGFLAILSLIFTGGVFGIFFPGNVPLWGAIVLVMVVTCFLKWPLKEARRSLWYGGRGHGPWDYSPFGHLCASTGWILLLVLFVWFANRHFPGFHDALMQLNHIAHHAVNSLRAWWDSSS